MYLKKDLISLRTQMLTKVGISTVSKKDCSTISVMVFLETGHYISETTIKRIFDLTPVINDFTPFILHALSNFLGCKDWGAFKTKHCNDKHSIKQQIHR